MVGGGTFITRRTFRADSCEVGFLFADLRFAVFLVGALLAFVFVRLVTFLALAFFLDFFALRAMYFFSPNVLMVAEPDHYKTPLVESLVTSSAAILKSPSILA